jgi:hypothetical protein
LWMMCLIPVSDLGGYRYGLDLAFLNVSHILSSFGTIGSLLLSIKPPQPTILQQVSVCGVQQHIRVPLCIGRYQLEGWAWTYFWRNN